MSIEDRGGTPSERFFGSNLWLDRDKTRATFPLRDSSSSWRIQSRVNDVNDARNARPRGCSRRKITKRRENARDAVKRREVIRKQRSLLARPPNGQVFPMEKPQGAGGREYMSTR